MTVKRFQFVLVLIFCFILGGPVNAGVSGSYALVIASWDEADHPVVLRKRADFVTVTVRVSSDQKDPKQRLDEIARVKQIVIEAAKQYPQLTIHEGPGDISIDEGSALSSFKSYSGSAQSDAKFNLLYPLGEDADIHNGAAAILKFLSSVALPPKVELHYSDIQLAIKDPEQYRGELLQKIAEFTATTKTQLGTDGKAELSGLHKPVRVRRLDSQDVELFIDFELKIVHQNALKADAQQ